MPFPLLPFCFRGFHEHPLAHLGDVELLDQAGQFLGYAILLEYELFTDAHGFGLKFRSQHTD